MNKYLTTAMHRFLTVLRDSKDGYALQERNQYFIDHFRFHSKTADACIALCLIKEDMDIWVLTADGRKVLEDKNYVPQIVGVIRKAVPA